MDLQSLKTPSLILDIERVRRNAERTKELAARHNVRLRPHIKTHKCIEVAEIQTDASRAVTVSTLVEAEAFFRHGFRDLTYAVPIERGKFSEAIEMTKRGAELNLLTDDVETPSLLNHAARQAGVNLNVFMKVDCGYHRCGVEPSNPAAKEIARLLSDASNLEFAGILTHAGHSYNARTKEEIIAIAREERDVMANFAEELRGDGIEVPTVSIGSTPTIQVAENLAGVDEIRPGNYIFFDAYQATLGSCGFADCALTVLTAVTHRDRSRRKIIVDAGAIAMSKDRGAIHIDENCGYGRVLDLEGNELNARLESLSQEHGVFHVADETVFDRIKVGTRLRILANHSCLSAAQHSHYNVLENGEIVAQWEIHRGW